MVWNLFPFKGDFSFRKTQKSQGTKSGLSGGWITWAIWCSTKNPAQDVLCELVHCPDEAVNHLLRTAVAFWIIQVVFMEECSSLTQNWVHMHCFPRSVILNAMVTQCTCSLTSVYCHLWLVQWRRHCSCMHIPVHSPWLPGYIDVLQTILIILTRGGPGQERLCTCIL